MVFQYSLIFNNSFLACIVIFGLFGNGVGLMTSYLSPHYTKYVSMSARLRRYILWANLINCLLIIPGPLLDYFITIKIHEPILNLKWAARLPELAANISRAPLPKLQDVMFNKKSGIAIATNTLIKYAFHVDLQMHSNSLVTSISPIRCFARPYLIFFANHKLIKGWYFYLVYIYTPLSRTLLTFNYITAGFFTANQMVAICFPYKYKSICTPKVTTIAAIFGLIYSGIWSMSYLYYMGINEHVLEYNNASWYLDNARLRDNYGGQSESAETRIFNSNNTVPDDFETLSNYTRITKLTSLYRNLRIPNIRSGITAINAYNICVEIFGRLLPFLIQLILKSYIIYHRGLKEIWGSSSFSKMSQSYVQQIELYELEELSNNSISSVTRDHNKTANKPTFFSIRPTKVNDELPGNSSLMPKSISSKRIEKIRCEMLNNIMLLIILALEFIVFLLPLTIFHLILPSLPKSYLTYSTLFIWSCLYMLEYLYICSTFYLNFAFNKYYRKDVIALFNTYILSWHRCHGNNRQISPDSN